jgi:hypothetical protein
MRPRDRHPWSWSADMGIVTDSDGAAAVPYSRDWNQYTGSRWLPAGQRSTESMKSSISWTIDPPTLVRKHGTSNTWSSGLVSTAKTQRGSPAPATHFKKVPSTQLVITGLRGYQRNQPCSTPRLGRQQKQDRRIEKLQLSQLSSALVSHVTGHGFGPGWRLGRIGMGYSHADSYSCLCR